MGRGCGAGLSPPSQPAYPEELCHWIPLYTLNIYSVLLNRAPPNSNPHPTKLKPINHIRPDELLVCAKNAHGENLANPLLRLTEADGGWSLTQNLPRRQHFERVFRKTITS